MTKYCRYCGKRLTSIKSGDFDEDTGQPLYKDWCSNFWCPDKRKGELIIGIVYTFFIVGLGVYYYWIAIY